MVRHREVESWQWAMAPVTRVCRGPLFVSRGGGRVIYFQSSDPDPVEWVSSVIPGYRFHCPDVATVDGHISLLLATCGPDSNLMPARKTAWRRDIDALLERRTWLALMSEAA
jgi:hypothetical protein